jgi:hypothetical protein
MPRLIIRGPIYGSPGDEAAFFHWLQSIGCVRRVGGSGYDLHIDVKRSRISNADLRELCAILFRYRMPMVSLAIFRTPQNESWFAKPGAYWFDGVFCAPPKASLKRTQRKLPN